MDIWAIENAGFDLDDERLYDTGGRYHEVMLYPDEASAKKAFEEGYLKAKEHCGYDREASDEEISLDQPQLLCRKSGAYGYWFDDEFRLVRLKELRLDEQGCKIAFPNGGEEELRKSLHIDSKANTGCRLP